MNQICKKQKRTRDRNRKKALTAKILSLLLLFTLVLPAFTACSGSNGSNHLAGDRITIVTTIFPEYDWVMNILGDNPANIEVKLLLDSGVDLHSYEPSVEDILSITRSDIFIYVGGESDEWADDIVKNAQNADITVISLMDSLGGYVKEEELVEGMEGEDEEGEEGEEPEYDEHVWLSLRNAKILTAAIEKAVEEKDPANAATYKSNLEKYTEKLDFLDSEYKTAVDFAPYYTLVFADRFPFRYLVDDYNLDYYAAFVGCSAESEASFETIRFLADKIDELDLPAVLTIEGGNHKIAETVLSQTSKKDCEILSLNSMQSTTMADVNNGTDYIKIMTENLNTIKKALGSDSLNPYDANSTTAMLSGAPDPEVELPEITSSVEGIDIDLPSMSSTIVYAQVYDMISKPDKYIGKTVRMTGTFGDYYDTSTGNHYYGCIVKDATACCAQGIEFVPVSDYKYPDDYPEVGSEITITGTFSTYYEGDDIYCTLKDSVFE